MEFYKMEGCGNDYIYIDNRDHKYDDWITEEKIKQYCKPHTGIGSDGLISIEVNAQNQLEMVMYNADGSKGGMCGNGLRCMTYLVLGILQSKANGKVLIATKDRKVHCELLSATTTIGIVRIDMGIPIWEPSAIPTKLSSPANRILQFPYQSALGTHQISLLSFGNPHLILYVPNLSTESTTWMESFGFHCNHHADFPEGMNVSYVEVYARNHIKIRTYERGSGWTLACGSGACASFYITHHLGRCDAECVVEMVGGNVRIIMKEERVYMEGEARLIYRGVYL